MKEKKQRRETLHPIQPEAADRGREFYDCTGPGDAVSILTKKGPILPAGTTIYSMPVSDRNAEYERIAEQFDLRFIFDDRPVSCDFYAVPRLDIMAVDSAGGYIGMLGNICDLEEDRPVYYVDSKGRPFIIAESGPDFVRHMPHWKEKKIPTEDVHLFASRKEAERVYAIRDLQE